jgi:hypothetical protein
MIPKRIHQVWIGHNVPPQWANLAKTWRRHHPEWAYDFWDDAKCRCLVAERYPELLQRYDSYPYDIQRADAVRYVLLHCFGGVYVDMDIECLRPIDALVEGQTLVTVREPPEHASELLAGQCLSNAFMAVVPGHSFLKDVVEGLAHGPSTAVTHQAVTHQDVSDSTGPGMLEVAFRRSRVLDVEVLDHGVIFPYPRETAELSAMLENQADDAIPLKLSCIVNGAYAVHYWAGSWLNLRGEELVNPDPHDVAGFRFFPRLDSVGFDIANVGRNVPKLADACAANDVAVGFNTDGFIKSRVRPPWQWEKWRARSGKEGLYIKRSALARPFWRLFGIGR